MRKIISLSILLVLILSSCNSLRKNTLNTGDDMYDDPAEIRRQQLAAQAKAREDQEKSVQQWYAQKENEMSSDPKYRDPEVSAEDYYDYEYASRLKRFHSYNPGLGYYDDWYTNPCYNSGFGNPWAQSIYNSYYPGFGWAGPGWGTSVGLGWTWGSSYPYYGWGWNAPWYSSFNYGYGMNYPYYGYGVYSPYYYGNLYGYESPSHFGPRGNAGGFTSPVRSFAGMSRSEAEKNLESGRIGLTGSEKNHKFQSFDSYFTLKDHPNVYPGKNSLSGSENQFSMQNPSSSLPTSPQQPIIPRNGIRSALYSGSEESTEHVLVKDLKSSIPSQQFGSSTSPVRPRSGVKTETETIQMNQESNPLRLQKPERIPSFTPSEIKISSPRSSGGIQIRPR